MHKKLIDVVIVGVAPAVPSPASEMGLPTFRVDMESAST